MKTGLGLKRKARTIQSTIKAFGKPKIFCIGFNKTGTTSLKTEMALQGFTVGNQRQAELLFDDWVKRDFKRLIRYCRTAEFFQDVPFSYPYTFIAMDQAFPGSKFILTVRNNAEQWYNSLIRFHGKLWGNGNVPPTTEDLKNATYIEKGRPYRNRFLVHDVPEDDPYKKDVMIAYYHNHNNMVMDYFRHRSQDLLIINLKNPQDYLRFCEFIGQKPEREGFPWENKT